MSIDEKFNALLAAMTAQTTAILANNDLMAQTIATRLEAMAAIKAADAPTEAKPTRRSSKAAETPAATTEAPKTEAPAATKPAISVDEIRNAFAAYLNGGADPSKPDTDPTNVDARKARITDGVKPMLAHFGADMVVGTPAAGDKPAKTGIPAEKYGEAIFYIKRLSAGLPVDYSADYDFDADPLTQGVPEPVAADDDDMGV